MELADSFHRVSDLDFVVNVDINWNSRRQKITETSLNRTNQARMRGLLVGRGKALFLLALVLSYSLGGYALSGCP